MHILMYHLVADLDDPMAVPVTRFREQMQLLATGPYMLLTETDLHTMIGRGIDPGPGAVLITFDDGYTNTITTALPVLDELDLPALMAVCGGYFGPDRPARLPHVVQEMAHLEQVRTWIDSGRDIAAHSYTHHRLTTATDAALHWQIAGDHEILAELLGRVPRTFVYPYGAYDQRVQRVVAQRYPLAMGTDEKHRPDVAHPYCLPRIQVDPGWSLTAFEAALAEDTDPATAQAAARRVDARAAIPGGSR